MNNTKKIRSTTINDEKIRVELTLKHLIDKLKNELKKYETLFGKPYKIQLKEEIDYDYINPQHYVQSDGKQTWEHMVDKYGLYETAVFCKINAFKYKERLGKKPNEDVEREQAKIDWYEAKAAELFEKHEMLNNEENWGFLKTD